MILFSIGLPGPFASWSERLIARLAASDGGSGQVATSVLPAIDQLLQIHPLPPVLDAVGQSLIRGASRHFVVGVHQPDDRLLAAISASGARFIVALEDPRAVTSDLAAASGGEPGLVTRAIANCCPLMMRFATLPGALTLHAERAALNGAAAAAMIASHLGFDLDNTAVAAAIREAANDHRGILGGDATADPRNALSQTGLRMAEAALAYYAGQFRGTEEVDSIVWNRELFMLNAEGFQRPTGIVEVAGAPRTLLTGPFIHLPPGRWTAQIVFGVSPEAAGNAFAVYVLADTQVIGQALVAPVSGGVVTAQIEFSLERQSAKGLEIPLVLTTNCAHGQLAFGHVVVQPLAVHRPAAADASADFERVLDL